MTYDEIRNQRNEVFQEARKWVDTPFHHMAKVMHGGVDCAQLLYAVYKKVLGIEIQFPIFPGYPKGQYPAQWHLHNLDDPARAEFYLSAFRNPIHEMIEFTDSKKSNVGDIVLSLIGRTYCHGGIVAGWPMVIQSESAPCGAGKVIIANAKANWFLSNRDLIFFSRRAWHVN